MSDPSATAGTVSGVLPLPLEERAGERRPLVFVPQSPRGLPIADMILPRLLRAVAFSVAALVLAQNAFSAEPLTRPARITFDQAGALVIDGRKVFPINLTVIPPPDAKAPNGKQAYAEFRDGGALFRRPGGPRGKKKPLDTDPRYKRPPPSHGLRCCPW